MTRYNCFLNKHQFYSLKLRALQSRRLRFHDIQRGGGFITLDKAPQKTVRKLTSGDKPTFES